MKDKTFKRPLTEDDYKAYDKWAEWCNVNQYVIMDDNEDHYYCKKIDTSMVDKENAIINLKRQLLDLDYKTNKYIEGEITETEWKEVIALRKSLRAKINELEGE